MRPLRGAVGSPLGGGTRATMASRISGTPVPSLAEASRTSSRGMARMFSSSSLAGLQAAADLVGEVNVAGRVDQVQAVVQAVSCLVVEANGAGLDGDAVLALEVHRVEHLARHLSRLDRVRQLQEAVGQGGLAVIDVGDDREVAQARLGDHGEPEYIGYEWVPQDLGPVG